MIVVKAFANISKCIILGGFLCTMSFSTFAKDAKDKSPRIYPPIKHVNFDVYPSVGSGVALTVNQAETWMLGGALKKNLGLQLGDCVVTGVREGEILPDSVIVTENRRWWIIDELIIGVYLDLAVNGHPRSVFLHSDAFRGFSYSLLSLLFSKKNYVETYEYAEWTKNSERWMLKFDSHRNLISITLRQGFQTIFSCGKESSSK